MGRSATSLLSHILSSYHLKCPPLSFPLSFLFLSLLFKGSVS
uniref:Uncharacterized protein n=1 Tax=Anguilla anguilla TaxID=7936 RepID=A0A0E9SDS1_ANGAN